MNEKNKTSGVGIAALCCGIACFCINPLYLTCLAAVVLGIVGLCIPGKKLLPGIGLGLGIAGTVTQFIADLILSIFTLGLSFIF